MKVKFTEEKLEQAFIELMDQEGYLHTLGNTITRKEDEVIIQDDLRNYLKERYQSANISVVEIDSIILQLSSLSDTDIYESNKTCLLYTSPSPRD